MIPFFVEVTLLQVLQSGRERIQLMNATGAEVCEVAVKRTANDGIAEILRVDVSDAPLPPRSYRDDVELHEPPAPTAALTVLSYAQCAVQYLHQTTL